MGITVAIHTKHNAFGDDGELFEFTNNDPDLGKFITDWTNEESFDYAELWVTN